MGWDGADWRLVQELMAEGELPNLSKLARDGSHGPLATLRPTLSPALWTSIATGVSPDAHGIEGFWKETSASDFMDVPQTLLDQLDAVGYLDKSRAGMRFYRSSDRRAEALWNLIEARGLSSSVVGWWATYPAEPLDGGMVTDRFLYQRFQIEAEKYGLTYERDEALVHPPGWENELAPLVTRPDHVDTRTIERFVTDASVRAGDIVLHDPIDELRLVFAKDVSTSRLTRFTMDANAPDAVFVYFQGSDIASHYFWKYRFTEEWNWVYPDEAVGDEARARFRDTIAAYYHYLDEELGELLARTDERTLVVVCSDHGFVVGKREGSSTVSGVHLHAAPPGILVLSGAGIRPGIELEAAHLYDIAPTILEILGIPYEGLEGVVLKQALVSE